MGGHHRETQGRTGFEFPDGPKHPRTIELAKKIEQATKMATIYGCMASLPAMLRSKVERGIMTLDKAIEHLRSGAGKKERLIYKGLSEKCNNRIVYCEGCSAGRSKKAANPNDWVGAEYTLLVKGPMRYYEVRFCRECAYKFAARRKTFVCEGPIAPLFNVDVIDETGEVVELIEREGIERGVFVIIKEE